MKKLILAALCAASLAGCAQVAPGSGPVSAASSAAMSQAQLQANWLQACLAYEGAQKAAIANMARMSNANLQRLLIVTHQITPICLKQPADLNAATVQITAAVTTIGILSAAQAAGAVK
ncbi:MAG: hypothetical protein KGL42_08685 [Betaproteobacteria bacterium]|nr:hypothetical protein [Betaproteobacteria bacterium]